MKAVCELTKPYGIRTIVSMNPIMVDGTGMCGACRVTVGDKVKFAFDVEKIHIFDKETEETITN